MSIRGKNVLISSKTRVKLTVKTPVFVMSDKTNVSLGGSTLLNIYGL